MSRRTAAARAKSRRLAVARAEHERARERAPDPAGSAGAATAADRPVGRSTAADRPVGRSTAGIRSAGAPATGDRRRGPGLRALEPSPPEDAIALYRSVTRYGWTMRASLAVSLALLVASAGARDLGQAAPDVVSELGLGFMFLFISLAGVKHYRALYRMRRRQVWSNSGSFMLAMLGAPFGAGDPESTDRDRWLLRATLLLGVLLLIAEVVAGITHR